MTDMHQTVTPRSPQDIEEGAERAEYAPRTLTEALVRARWIVGQTLAGQDGKSSGRPIMNDEIDKMPDSGAPPEANAEGDVTLNDDVEPLEPDAEAMAETDREMAERKSHVRRKI